MVGSHPRWYCWKNCYFFLYYAEERRCTIPITKLKSTCIEEGIQRKIKGCSFFQNSYVLYLHAFTDVWLQQYFTECDSMGKNVSISEIQNCQFSVGYQGLTLRLVRKCWSHNSEINFKWLRALLFGECHDV